jgi:phthalate 4,5-cis-dihydrodiol dehydrogenase
MAASGTSGPLLRIGVIGLGRAGSGMLGALARHPDIRVTAAADLYREHRDRFQNDFGGEAYADAEALCHSPNVDAVYIATPHELHCAHVQLAAAHGKHVIVEKPMALTLEDCDQMIAATEAAGVQMVVGHTASFNPSVQKMRQLIRSGDVGALGMISASAYTDFLYRPRRPEELRTELGGGIIYNQVPHQVDAARFLAGGIARGVRASAWILDPQRPTEGCSMALVDFESGAAAALVYSGYDHFNSHDIAAGSAAGDPRRYGKARRALGVAHSPEQETALRVSTGYGGEQSVSREREARGDRSLLQPELGSLIVTCEKADLRMAPEGVAIYSDNGLTLVPPEPWRGVPGRGAVIDELYYAVSGQRPLVHHGRWAKASLEVCLAILESARDRKEVPLQFQVPTVDIAATGAAVKEREV